MQSAPPTLRGKAQAVQARPLFPELPGLLGVAFEIFRGYHVHFFRLQWDPRVKERPSGVGKVKDKSILGGMRNNQMKRL